MNKIIYARRENLDGEITAKGFEVLLPDLGMITIIPPMKTYVADDFTGIRIIFDNALLPFKDFSYVLDNEENAICFAAEQAVKYFESEFAKKEFVLNALANLLICYLTAFSDGRKFSPVVELVREELSKGVSDCGFSIKNALKKLPLNYDYIRKLFKKETGATPYEYLLKERMTLAAQIISGGASNKFSEYSVSQIAEACGYSEPLYFSRVFKQYFGVSPSEYK